MTFDDVREFLAKIPNIDYGGCGISALSMGRWLDKKYGKKERLFAFEYYDKNLAKCNSAIIKKRDYLQVNIPSHIYLFDGQSFEDFIYVIDASEDDEISLETVTLVNAIDLIKLLRYNDDWNEEFDRNHYIPIIEKRLGIYLKDIKRRKK